MWWIALGLIIAWIGFWIGRIDRQIQNERMRDDERALLAESRAEVEELRQSLSMARDAYRKLYQKCSLLESLSGWVRVN